MHVTICIVAFRNADEVARCVAALMRQSHTDHDIVICENGGEEAWRALEQAVAAVRPSGPQVRCLLAGGNLGYAGGVNHCIRASADSDGWWIVNPDTEPHPDALRALVERLARGGCHAVGGILHHADGRVQAYGGRWRPMLARSESIGHGHALGEPVDAAAVEARMNYILGASMLVGRDLVDRVGLMREDYFLYCEEVEWALRAGAHGLRLGFAPKSRVCHGQGGTTGSADPICRRPRLPIYLDERNKINVVRDTTPLWLVVAIPAALLLLTMRYAARGAWRQWGYALSGWLAGVTGRRGLPPWMR